MARPFRILYPNAFYHVTCRGNDWRVIFCDDHWGDRDFVEKLKGMKDGVIKGSVKDQPSYRMMQSVEPEALIKQAADYFRLGEADLTRKRGRHRQERALVMELLHRYSGLSSG